MALTSTEPAGFRPHDEIDGDTVIWLPGDASTTFTKGDGVILSATGGIALATDSTVPLAYVHNTTVTPAATVAFPRPAAHIVNREVAGASAATLVPCKLNISGVVKRKKCLFKNHLDDGVTSYTASTRALVHDGSALGSNDEGIGGLMYVYDGPGAGQVNIVSDYVTATKTFTMMRDFEVAPTSASSFILLGTTGADLGIGPLDRIDIADEDELDVIDGNDDGKHVVVLDWRESAEFLSKLILPVVPVTAFPILA